MLKYDYIATFTSEFEGTDKTAGKAGSFSFGVGN